MEARPLHLKLDLVELKEVSLQGIRRAAAFLGIGLNATRDWSNPSLTLDSFIKWQFFPEPIPEEQMKNAVEEFQRWVIGNSLRELDASFNTFLDGAWGIKEWAKLHKTSVKSSHKIATVSADTNAANKLEKILRDLDGDLSDVPRLKTLSNLRNCLTHARGIVTERHANEDGKLKIRWLGLELGFVQGDSYSAIPHEVDAPYLQAPDPSQPADVVIKFSERERCFGMGSAISISPRDLQEICFFYQRLTDQVVPKLHEFIIARGIEPV